MDIDNIIARLRCPKVMECPIKGPVVSCKECRRTVKEDAAAALSTLQAENEKMRSELEQMTACIYYKPGGLCRYGGDDPANVCVFGPCPHEVSAQEFLSELENVKRGAMRQ